MLLWTACHPDFGSFVPSWTMESNTHICVWLEWIFLSSLHLYFAHSATNRWCLQVCLIYSSLSNHGIYWAFQESGYWSFFPISRLSCTQMCELLMSWTSVFPLICFALLMQLCRGIRLIAIHSIQRFHLCNNSFIMHFPLRVIVDHFHLPYRSLFPSDTRHTSLMIWVYWGWFFVISPNALRPMRLLH